MTYHSKAGEVLSLPNCSLTIKTLEGIEYFQNIHKTARICAKEESVLDRILEGYKTGKRGVVNAKRC